MLIVTKQKPKVPSTVISWFFLLYFVILFAERLQSLLRAVSANQFFMDTFESVAGVIVSLSLLSAVVLLAFCNKPFWKSLAGKAEPDYNMMTVTAGISLSSAICLASTQKNTLNNRKSGLTAFSFLNKKTVTILAMFSKR